MDRAPAMVAFGCGVDSTAMCLGLYERNLFPDAILFADTGGEKPDTYQFLFTFDKWLAEHGFPLMPNVWERPPGYDLPEYGLPRQHPLQAIQVVRNDGRYGTLERNCLEQEMVPSLAYGRRGCSEKYKLRPQHKWARHWEPARLWWRLNSAGRRQPSSRRDEDRLVIKLIGYDYGEIRRSDITSDGFYEYLYPLRQWRWLRQDCLSCIERHGLPVPPKSACFFCPGSRKQEIVQLGLRYPALLHRALDMERKAQESGSLRSVKGLGRSWSWNEFAANDRRMLDKPDPPPIGCICQGEVFEGEGVDDEQDECDPEE